MIGAERKWKWAVNCWFGILISSSLLEGCLTGIMLTCAASWSVQRKIELSVWQQWCCLGDSIDVKNNGGGGGGGGNKSIMLTCAASWSVQRKIELSVWQQWCCLGDSIDVKNNGRGSIMGVELSVGGWGVTNLSLNYVQWASPWHHNIVVTFFVFLPQTLWLTSGLKCLILCCLVKVWTCLLSSVQIRNAVDMPFVARLLILLLPSQLILYAREEENEQY